MRPVLLALLLFNATLALSTEWVLDHEEGPDGSRCTAQSISPTFNRPLWGYHVFVLGNGTNTPEVLMALERGTTDAPTISQEDAAGLNSSCYSAPLVCGSKLTYRVAMAVMESPVLRGLNTRPGDLITDGWESLDGVRGHRDDANCVTCSYVANVQLTEHRLQWRTLHTLRGTRATGWRYTWAPWRTQWAGNGEIGPRGYGFENAVSTFPVSGFMIHDPRLLNAVLAADATHLEMRYTGAYPSMPDVEVTRITQFDAAALARAVRWVRRCSG